MNTIAMAFALLAISSGALRAAPPAGGATPEPKACRAEVVRPDHGPDAGRFVAWLRAHREARPDPEHPGEILAQAEVLIADIDNDGQDEYVLVPERWIYKRSGDGWALVETPEELVEARGYYDSLRDEATPLLRFCGRTLVALAGGAGPNPWRQAYLWQGGKVKPVCDAAWLEEQRRSFQELFDRGLFDRAYGFLEGATSSCLPPPDPALWRWMESDLALAAHRMRTHRTCLEHVTAAEKAPAAVADPVLARALANTRRLCTAALAAGPAAYDYTWLLALERNLKRNPWAEIVSDPHFNDLLSAAVPDVKFKDGEPFRDVLELRLGKMGGIKAFGDRSLVVSGGCMPHDCGSQYAWVWVDLQRQRSIVVTVASLDGRTAEESESLLALGSNTIPAAQVPAEFWTQMDEVLRQASGGLDVKLSDFVGDGMRTVYAGPDGRWADIALPAARDERP